MNVNHPNIKREDNIRIAINHSFGFSEENDRLFSVNFEIEIGALNSNLFLKVESSGFFETQNAITDDFKKSSFITKSAPAITFPYLRAFIGTLTNNAGILPLNIPAFNFTQ